MSINRPTSQSKRFHHHISRWSLMTTCFIFALLGTIPLEGWAIETRTIDGTYNNVQNPEWGSADSQLDRTIDPDYQDDIAQPAEYSRPSPRSISNIVAAQSELRFNDMGATDMVWQWGQFIDHDLDLTTEAHPPEEYDIKIPEGDTYFDPQSSGNEIIPFHRSVYDPNTGTDTSNPRQQLNNITSYLDGSMIYGSDPQRALALRTLDGTGRLKTSKKNLLPFNTDGLPNAGGPDPNLFLAGDIRANEQVGLTTMHTLFVREHNRLAKRIRKRNRHLTGDQIYERARRRVGAFIQVITYNEFIPVLLGPKALSPYGGYNTTVDASAGNIFSTAAYRLGHSMLSPEIFRLKKNGKPIRAGHLALRDAFFAPGLLRQEGGIEPILRGLSRKLAQEVDNYVIDDVRNFLFGKPGEGGLDLVSLNIQRGRDHGLPTYNEARLEYGFTPAADFSQISSDPEIQERLALAYDHQIEMIDVWVGGLAEDHVPGALVGPLFFKILKEQFERFRDGDRFFYKNMYSRYEIKRLENTTLADIIRRNTRIGHEIQDNVFRLSHKKYRKHARDHDD
ncbi:peroxidase family protein [Candidatus Nitronereus thalassa]|uniref:Peroxidase family protein n=1 Tax=Candidatus Nitronereus thalassa TaxID=3020898 RepID=A0ABU3KCR8_9BACT|nr:peroxidase family protein [Candidatus Nitronereus thalassa]MDT7044019.1 peroxidase family protein [Candidatus Nitronereus thalassa]